MRSRVPTRWPMRKSGASPRREERPVRSPESGILPAIYGSPRQPRCACCTDSRTPALDINVETHAGVVTLFGIVPSQDAKSAAEADARKVSGVKRVVNELQVVVSAKQADGEGARRGYRERKSEESP